MNWCLAYSRSQYSKRNTQEITLVLLDLKHGSDPEDLILPLHTRWHPWLMFIRIYQTWDFVYDVFDFVLGVIAACIVLLNLVSSESISHDMSVSSTASPSSEVKLFDSFVMTCSYRNLQYSARLGSPVVSCCPKLALFELRHSSGQQSCCQLVFTCMRLSPGIVWHGILSYWTESIWCLTSSVSYPVSHASLCCR